MDEYRGAKAYLLTLATAGRAQIFTDGEIVEHCIAELRSVAEALHFDVLAYCFMPDHLHLLTAGIEADSYVVDFVKRFKQKTGFWFRRKFRGGLKASPAGLWQPSYHDHILRSDEALRNAALYILNNPIEAGLAGEVGDYPYAGSFVWPHLGPKSEVLERLARTLSAGR
ncbi:MAG TPA: transposase [Dehalococcoidia bacterium]|nr:transposase [Dehalococcoidia bacterium]